MARLATGIEGFDAMVQGGVPVGSSVVLQGPPGQEKLRFALTFLAEGLKAGASGLVVISSQSPDAVLAELRNLGVNLDAVTKEKRLRVVDWYSWSEESVMDVEERGAVVRSSIDLTNLGVALSRAIASLTGDQPRRAVIELLSPAMNVYELSQVYAFAQSAKKKFDRYQFTSLVLLEKDMHSGPEITTLHQPFDGVIEIERTRSGDRIVRKIGVLHLKDTTPDPTFRVLEMTEAGMRVVRDAPKTAPSVRATPGDVLESQEERARRLTLIMQIASERLKLNPRDADALFAMAAAQATLDDARGALQSLDRLADLDPNYPGLWVLKTKLHARLGETDRARQSRLRSQQVEPEEGEPARPTVPCPMCEAPVAADATSCANCGVKFASARSLEDELEDLGHAAIQEMVEEELQTGTPPATPAVPKRRPEPATPVETSSKPPARLPPSAAPKPVAKPVAKKGLTNGLVLGRGPGRRAGMTNGLKGRTNGLRGRTNGLTNGVGRTNGLTNGIGRTNGLTNGVGRTNGLTNGLGRTNGITNGLGRTNGITNGLGRTNGLTNGLGGLRPTGFRSSGLRGMMRTAGWKLYVIPLVVVVLLLMPLFLVPEYRGPAYPIQIDGQFGDWASVPTEAMTSGAVLNPNIDVIRFGAVENLGPFAFYVQVAGNALQGGGPAPGTMDTIRIFIDSDGAATTGYRIDGLGADRMIEISGYGGIVRAGTLWEFDSNRDSRDWNGWIKGTGTPAAASGSQVEAEAEWLSSGSTAIPIIASVHTASWDGQSDSGDFPVSPSAGTLSVIADPQVPDVLAGIDLPLLRLILTAHGEPVSVNSLQVQLVGTAPPTSAVSLRLMDGTTVLGQVAPGSRDVTFSFPPLIVSVGSPTALSLVGDFTASTGETFGVRLPSAHPFGFAGAVVGLQENPGARTVGYLGLAPSGPQVDGAFDEWTAVSSDAASDVTPRANPNIDIARYGAQHGGAATYLYTDVTGRILRGTPTPESAAPTPQGPPPTPDTDRDTVPDSIDPMPFDFNNDGIPDVQTNGDYDADGIPDYGFPGGTDYWLNTTLPTSFPAPYAGLSVSVYIGPTNRPPLFGEDVLRVFLDIDNSTWSGYAIGGIGADRLVELRGKDGQMTQSALLAFSGSFPGEWSWSPVGPVTVALGYHAIELSVPLNATNLYVEAGDFWGSVDTTTAVPALAPPGGSFKVAAANSILSVPWAQVGPQPSATLIDGSSNSATTVYNHQRKVVRAGSGAGATPCDATNSAGCWYVVFYDQLAQDPYDSGPSTETVTTGTKVSGTFSTDVLSNNNVYINYREVNTGSQTVVSNNPTAVGTAPACAWTNCANGETSNNAYADSSVNKQVVSFKTFGFSVPSGATINKVEFGVEAYQDTGGNDQIDTMALSWNAGTGYCTNTQAITPGTTDPNAYTYSDVTTCTGHTWAQADFTGDNIAWQGQYNNIGTPTPVHLDAVVVRVTYTPGAYVLQVQYDFTGVPAGDTNTLNIEAYHSADENVNVQVLTPPSTWNSQITITASSDPGTAQTYTLTSTEFNSGAPSIRFVDASGSDTTQTDLFVDLATITTTMTKTPGTETITTGTKVAGTFPSGISTADATYIQYREANTGSQTVVSNNPTAVGTAPACAWTNCAFGETSNNGYADSSTLNQVISFKTFGFSVPSGATINKVEFGVEAYQDTGGDDQIDTMALSWNAGTGYCTNTQATTPGTTDPNAYTYFNVTTCTGHTWAQADFTGDNIAWDGQYHKVTGTATPIHLDAVVVRVTYTPITYVAQVQYDWSGVPSGDVYTLNVKGYRQDEDISVQVLTPPSTWTTRITISATANTLYTYPLSVSEYNSGSPSVRFVDAGGGETTQSDFWLDQAVVTTTSYWDRIYLMRSLDTSGSTWGSQILLASGRVGGDPLLYTYDSAEPSIAIDSSGYLHITWVSAGSTGNQQTLNRVRYTKTTVAYPTQSQLASSANWQTVTVVDDSSLGFMPTVSTDTSNNPHLAWSGSKTSGTVYYKNMFGGAWKPTVSWGSTYTGISVDVSPQNNYVNLVRYYEAATNEIQYTVCRNLATNNCDATNEFTKWDGTAGYDTVATSVETGAYPSLATTYESNGDLWIAYAKDVDGTTRAIYARFLDYPSNGFATAETVDSLSGTRFTRPSIGVDNGGGVHALYVAISGPQLYYKLRTGGIWGSRTAVDSSTDYPSLMVRAPNDATYGVVSGAVYWKTSTSETYFYYIPEFGSVVLPVAGALMLVLLFGRRARPRREAGGVAHRA